MTKPNVEFIAANQSLEPACFPQRGMSIGIICPDPEGEWECLTIHNVLSLTFDETGKRIVRFETKHRTYTRKQK